MCFEAATSLVPDFPTADADRQADPKLRPITRIEVTALEASLSVAPVPNSPESASPEQVVSVTPTAGASSLYV